jgi:hypothetical protein
MYKTACFFASLLYVVAPASAQKNKISLSAYVGSGVSWYGGKSVAKTATYYPTPNFRTIPAYVDRPYGNKVLTNWIGGVRVDYFHPTSNWNVALNVQGESTGGRGTITKEISSSGTRDVRGKYRKSNGYLSVNPQVGNMLWLGKTTLLLRAGIDYAFHVGGSEEYTAPDQNGLPYIVGYSGVTGRDDLRLTANILIPLGWKWELDIGYKYGLIKYANHNAYLRMLHFKLGFSIIRPKMKGGIPGTPKF